MNLDPLWLFLSVIPSGVGFVLFLYGKKEARFPQLISGLLLMVYPFFADTVTTLVVWGVVIAAGLWWALRLGW